MCHDAGFTFDENGRITEFERANCTNIRNMTYAQVMELEYAADYEVLGHYAKVCSFDIFIRICKENRKIAFVTLRENAIEALVPRVLEVLKKYCMEEHCVINSFTLETLQEVRKYSYTIPVSFVQPPREQLDKAAVESLIPLGNAIICMFLYGKEKRPDLWDASAESLRLAQDNDIQIYMAILNSYYDYSFLSQRGVQGMQIARAFMPYNRSGICFSIRVEKDGAKFENILNSDRLCADVSSGDGIITVSNIRNNGSGYGYDDGLPVLWLNRLPFSADVTCTSNPDCELTYRDNALVLNTGGIEGVYHIHIAI